MDVLRNFLVALHLDAAMAQVSASIVCVLLYLLSIVDAGKIPQVIRGCLRFCNELISECMASRHSNAQRCTALNEGCLATCPTKTECMSALRRPDEVEVFIDDSSPVPRVWSCLKKCHIANVFNERECLLNCPDTWCRMFSGLSLDTSGGSSISNEAVIGISISVLVVIGIITGLIIFLKKRGCCCLCPVTEDPQVHSRNGQPNGDIGPAGVFVANGYTPLPQAEPPPANGQTQTNGSVSNGHALMLPDARMPSDDQDIPHADPVPGGGRTASSRQAATDPGMVEGFIPAGSSLPQDQIHSPATPLNGQIATEGTAPDGQANGRNSGPLVNDGPAEHADPGPTSGQDSGVSTASVATPADVVAAANGHVLISYAVPVPASDQGAADTRIATDNGISSVALNSYTSVPQEDIISALDQTLADAATSTGQASKTIDVQDAARSLPVQQVNPQPVSNQASDMIDTTCPNSQTITSPDITVVHDCVQQENMIELNDHSPVESTDSVLTTDLRYAGYAESDTQDPADGVDLNVQGATSSLVLLMNHTPSHQANTGDANTPEDINFTPVPTADFGTPDTHAAEGSSAPFGRSLSSQGVPMGDNSQAHKADQTVITSDGPVYENLNVDAEHMQGLDEVEEDAVGAMAPPLPPLVQEPRPSHQDSNLEGYSQLAVSGAWNMVNINRIVPQDEGIDVDEEGSFRSDETDEDIA